MSNIVSLDIYRPVLMPDGAQEFVDAVSTLGRGVFDSPGNTLVTAGPGQRYARSVSAQANFYDWRYLRYYHYSASGQDVKRLGKKVYDATEKLFPSVEQELDDEESKRSIISELSRVAIEEYDRDDIEAFDLILDTVAITEDAMRFPGEKIITLQPEFQTHEMGRSNEAMARRMTTVAGLTVQSVLARHEEMKPSGVVDGVPIARTRENSEDSICSFAEAVRGILPIKVVLANVDRSFASK